MSKADDQAFRAIVASCELQSITAVRMSMDSTSADGIEFETVSVNMRDRAAWQLSESRDELKVEVDFVLNVTSETSDKKHVAEVRYCLLYSFASPVPDNSVTAEALELFANTNPRFNAWPFWREYVNYVTSYAGLPAIVLPLLKPNALQSSRRHRDHGELPATTPSSN